MNTRRGLTWLGLGLMWVGYWAPWIAHRAAALNLNGYELAEWITFLPQVGEGSLRLGRMDFLIPLAAIAVATAGWAAADGAAPSGARWLGRLVAMLGALAILPEYPFLLTAHADPELRPVLLLGIGTLSLALGSLVIQSVIGRRSIDYWLVACSLLSIVAFGFTVRALVMAWPPLAILFNKPPQLNWGPAALTAGAMLITGSGLFSMWNRR